MQEIYFYKEKQGFTQWWLLLVFIASNSVFVYGVCKQIILGQPFGDHPLDDTSLLVLTLSVLLITSLLFYSRLETRISAERIEVRLFPFMWRFKQIAWSDLESAVIRTYKPIAEYGGWGIRGLGKNRALNARGNQGLQLVFKDGRKLLIGTSKPDELRNQLALHGKPH